MSVCTFFGHRDCTDLQEERLRQAVEDLIKQGVTTFTVGHQGRNGYLVETADICLCYVCHTWGGAYRSVCKAKHRGLRIINLGTAELSNR